MAEPQLLKPILRSAPIAHLRLPATGRPAMAIVTVHDEPLSVAARLDARGGSDLS